MPSPRRPPHVQVSVEGVSPDQYLERFAWNEAKYPPRRPLGETVSAITETTQKLEDDLKVMPWPVYCSLPWSLRNGNRQAASAGTKGVPVWVCGRSG